jgi:hypothetical protein
MTMHKNYRYFVYSLVLSSGVLCSAYASDRGIELQQEILGQQADGVNLMAPSKIINVEDLFAGTLSEDDLKEVNNEQIKQYVAQRITNKDSIDGNLLAVVNELATEGYIEKIMSQKTIGTSEKKKTLPCIVDFKILKEDEFQKYFVDLHQSAKEYNQIVHEEGHE